MRTVRWLSADLSSTCARWARRGTGVSMSTFDCRSLIEPTEGAAPLGLLQPRRLEPAGGESLWIRGWTRCAAIAASPGC